MIRLYGDEKKPTASSKTAPAPIRLYPSTAPAAPSKPAAPSTTTAPLNFTPKPAYFPSNRTDISGKPLLTYSNPNLKMTQLLSDRVYPGFDPRIPQKLDRSILSNGRMPLAISTALRREMGAAYDDELDHAIALELSGSNQRTNLGVIPGRAKPGKAFQLDQLMNKLARDVIAGKRSLLDAQRAAAAAKGRKIGEDLTPEEELLRRNTTDIQLKPKPERNPDVTSIPQFKDNKALAPNAPAPTRNVTLKDTAKFAGNVAKDILQGTARSGGSVGLTLVGQNELRAEDQTSPLAARAHRIFFGDEPLKSLPARIKQGTHTAKSLGIPGPLAQPSAAIGVLGLTALDFTGWGGEEKAAWKAIAKATKIEDVAKTLTKLGIADDLVPALAKKLAKTANPQEVKAIVKATVETAAKEAPAAAKAINVARLDVPPESKALIRKTADEISPMLEKARGSALTHEEVVEAARESEILRQATTREATLKSEAALLKTRENLAALAKTGKVTPEFVDNLRIVAQEATRRGRELEALKITAEPELATTQARMIKKLVALGEKTEDIVKAADGVDFADARQATAFYRKFVKPTLPELVDEYRYINLLSSPRTHIVNAFSNLLQAIAVRPATRLFSGAIDHIASAVTGKEREYLIRQVPAYYRGAVSSIEEAASNALKALKGETFTLRPDLKDIPTDAKFLKPFQFVPRMLEASDQFFRTIIEAGEREALATRYRAAGKEINQAEIVTEAAKRAEELVFRKALDPSNATGQGTLLSHIDKITSQLYQLRKLPGVKWFIPFVQTPMNILKQGIEYTPLGLATLAGNTDKTAQLAKAAAGSLVLSGAGALALQGRTTWAVPANKKDREAFYAAGMQPYAVKIGDKWIGYSKLGPLAYPIAMAAAIRQYSTEDPKAALDTKMQKVQKILTASSEFFADQSYVQGVGDLLDTVRGDQTALNRLASNAPAQLIPLSSLLRWVTQITDPIYRDAERGLSVDAILENMKKGLPGLSTSIPAYEDSKGNPSRRQSPVLNALSPVPITTENPRERAIFNKRMVEARKRAIKNAKDNE